MEQQQDNDVYLFCYGYNNPKQVASLLNIPLSELLPKCIPCTLKGYKRAFAGKDSVFEYRSVATIIKDPEGVIETYAFKVKESQIKFIDEFEVYPEEYDRITVQWEDKNQQAFEAYVYVMNDIDSFVQPTNEYLIGVAQTIAAHYYLSGKQTDFQNFIIEIVSAKKNQVESVVDLKLDIEEYPELIREKFLK